MSTETLFSCGLWFSLFTFPALSERVSDPALPARHPRKAALNHKPHQGTSLEQWFGHFYQTHSCCKSFPCWGKSHPHIHPPFLTHGHVPSERMCGSVQCSPWRYLFSLWAGGGCTEASLSSVPNQPPFLPPIFPKLVGTRLGHRGTVLCDMSEGSCPKPAPSSCSFIYL